MSSFKSGRWIVAGALSCSLIAASFDSASAESKRYVNVSNGTTQAVGVTFTGSGSKPAAEGTVEKFNGKSFTLPDVFLTVKISQVKGCSGAVIRDIPLGKTKIIIQENCIIEVQ